MKHERLTHAQRKQQTQERLFDSARTVFLEKGVSATSVEDIAEAAGYTRGAFYSNFCNKQEVLAELLRRDAVLAHENLQTIIEKGGTPKEMLARAIAACHKGELDSDCFPLWVEAQLLARGDGAFGERLDALRREKLVEVSACIRTLPVDADSTSQVDADALAIALVSLCDGIQFFRMCNPQTVKDLAIPSALAELASCMSWQKREEKRSVAQRARETA
ncbi:TetR/AcrR family transcriptional regulator [Paraburkholderia sp. CNPSo 3274]|uniref:TetR/AcrR family transcriptional regulator n=1 Tax=Paraburkholderia sp. CNPSo 3274 TaxID=2940932 RepID=UPI0020B7330F|nr:TetR family transcriptional regulator [Paraburkholderia sp. CNPSo 3274]MCP3705661.1 TetR/AcrR family transcriptional regulator [Paraburkholderia sp. CNPSo 3274]